MTFNRTRFHHIVQEIPREVTGLNGKCFVHVDHDDAGNVLNVSFSEKGKDQSTLDKVFEALGAATTDILTGLTQP